MIFDRMTSYKMSKVSILTPETVEVWADKTVWYWGEAIRLSIGISPEVAVNAEELSADDAVKWGELFRNRGDASERAMNTSDLLYSRIKYFRDDAKTFIAFRPHDFMAWLEKFKLIYPKELYKSVMQRPILPIKTGCEEYIFKKKLQAWHVRVNGTDLDGIKDSIGMAYLRQLLQYPNHSINVLELQGVVGYVVPQNDIQSRDEDNNEGNQLAIMDEIEQPLIDDTTRRQCQAELDDLRARLLIAEENEDETADIQEDITTLQNYISGATALQGRERSFAGSLEKNRKSVSNAINMAIKNIITLEAIQMPASNGISDHLTRFIKKGTSCQYSPPFDLYWQF